MSIITSAERAGIKKGKIEGLHESIYDIFDVKFGKNIYELSPQLKQIQDVEILRKIRHEIMKAQTLEETKNLILLQISNWQKN